MGNLSDIERSIREHPELPELFKRDTTTIKVRPALGGFHVELVSDGVRVKYTIKGPSDLDELIKKVKFVDISYQNYEELLKRASKVQLHAFWSYMEYLEERGEKESDDYLMCKCIIDHSVY